MFSKFLPGQRDSQLLLDSDNFTYSRKKDKDTPLNTAWRCSKNRSLKSSVTPWSISIPTTLSARVLNHKTRGVGQSHLDSSTQSRSSDAKLFVLPPNCLTTANNDNFVLFDGEASNFSTTRNLSILADYPNWIGDGTFYGNLF